VTLSISEIHWNPPVRWYAALCCPDFPHTIIMVRDEIHCRNSAYNN